MANDILFSIITPTYNRQEFILKAIESVKAQKYQNWELIIIDDGSTDNTRTIVENQVKLDPRIKYHWQTNQERSTSRNNGIKKAKGDYICFLDSDDFYLDNHLLEFYNLIEKNQFANDFYFCNTYMQNAVSDDLIEIPKPCNLFQNNYDFLINNIIGTPRVCLHSSAFIEQNFNVDIKNGEDVELWLRIIGDKKIHSHNLYTQVFIEHQQRSINLESTEEFLQINNAWQSLVKKYKSKMTSEGFLFFSNQNNLKLSRYFLKVKSNKLFLQAIKNFTISPFSNFKEKCYLLYKGTLSFF